ncbi:hypothetical protein [Streptomyces sp. NPDC007984]|uniref:hypothetical protein n=1 Tax=Streptomyces sp. NPDC007984 TaxID=3364801 RepID=UPI0036EFEEE8
MIGNVFSPTGYVAFYLDEKGHRSRILPVVKFDDEGHALVLHPAGALVRADDRFGPEEFGGCEPLVFDPLAL